MELQPLEPGPPMRMLGWLRGTRTGSPWRAIPGWVRVVVAVAAILALGTWGFAVLPVRPRLGLWRSFYWSVKLYTLDLGPAGGSAEYRVTPNAQIVLALVGAAALVLRAALGLGRDRLRRATIAHVLRRHAIVCGAGVHGTRLAQELSKERDVVLVDIDSAAAGMRAPLGKFEWRLTGDCVQDETLIAAGVARAHWIVAVTGDDYVNSQIVSVIRSLEERLRPPGGAHVLVQVEDPSLARFLEEREGRAGFEPVVTPFSANAIAADELLRRIEADRPCGDPATSLLLAGDHPLIEALVLSVLRQGRVRRMRRAERSSDDGHAPSPPVHISVFGPGAVNRVEQFRSRWRPEPELLVLEARDAEPGPEVPAESVEWLREPARAERAIVACSDELDGIRMTLVLGRALGGNVGLTRVTTQAESTLDSQIELHTRLADRLSITDVEPLAGLAGNLTLLGRLNRSERLRVAIAAAAPVGPTRGSAGGYSDAELAAVLLDTPELDIYTHPAWRVRPRELPIAEAAVEPVPSSALVDARLGVSFESPATLRLAASRLDSSTAAAFLAWCEYARAVPQQLASQLVAEQRRHGRSEIGAVLALRARTLGEEVDLPGARPELIAGHDRVLILAGGAGSMSSETRDALEPLLERALQRYDGIILSGGTDAGMPGVAARVTQRLDLPIVGYVPPGFGDPRLYPVLRETATAEDFSIREPLAMWTDMFTAGVPLERVRMVACLGEEITIAEIVLARALGAHVGWIDPASEASEELDEALPFGADDVLQLPVDAMALRAFVTWSSIDERLREPVARFLHNAYRRRQRRRKPSEDPALAPWEDLVPALRRSNLGQADDIPSKLALLGKIAVPGGERLELSDDQVELLAAAEHGRWIVERLTAGWQLGQRQIALAYSPHLKPWDELTNDARDYDREAVRAIDGALASVGWGVAEA